MWSLGQTNDPEEVKLLLKTNIAGEFTLCTRPQGKIEYGVP
jgi:hypothetical protein